MALIVPTQVSGQQDPRGRSKGHGQQENFYYIEHPLFGGSNKVLGVSESFDLELNMQEIMRTESMIMPSG